MSMIFVRTYQDWHSIGRAPSQHLRDLRGIVLRYNLWRDARGILVLLLCIMPLVLAGVLALVGTLCEYAGERVLALERWMQDHLVRDLGVDRDAPWYDRLRRRSRRSRILPLGERRILAFACDGERIVARSGKPVDVSDMLTATRLQESPERELRMLWRNYAMARPEDLDDEARDLRDELLRAFVVEDHAKR